MTATPWNEEQQNDERDGIRHRIAQEAKDHLGQPRCIFSLVGEEGNCAKVFNKEEFFPDVLVHTVESERNAFLVIKAATSSETEEDKPRFDIKGCIPHRNRMPNVTLKGHMSIDRYMRKTQGPLYDLIWLDYTGGYERYGREFLNFIGKFLFRRGVAAISVSYGPGENPEAVLEQIQTDMHNRFGSRVENGFSHIERIFGKEYPMIFAAFRVFENPVDKNINDT